MSKRFALITAVAAAASAFVWTSAGTGAGSPLIIGVDTAKSGFQAGFDEPGVAAAQIAAAKFNQTGGILNHQIVFKYCDSKTDPALTANCAVKLLAEGAHFLIESCDYDIGGPGARIAEKQGIVNFSLCAGSPKWNSIGPHSYSMTFGSPTEAYVDGQWAYSGKLHCQTGYLLEDDTIDYSKAVGTYIKASFKGKIVGEDIFKNSDTSFTSEISHIQATNPAPQCIFLDSFPPGGVTLLRQLRAAGINQPVISPDGMDGSYWLSAIPNLSNFYYAGFVSIYGDDPNPKVNALVKQMEQVTHAKVLSGSTGVCGYSIIEALRIAAQRAGSIDNAAVNAQLQKFNKEPLLVGPTTFTATDRQSLGRPMRVIQVQNGKDKFVTIFQPTGVHA
jgi:branched-chain amino acid transport system substrate-binding protein